MRQFPEMIQSLAYSGTDKIEVSLSRLRLINQALSEALGVGTCLKPEVSIMLELYQAERADHQLTVTMLGLLDSIAPTTSLRYLTILEENGAIRRRAHDRDGRSTYVEISPLAKAALDAALLSDEVTESISYKPTL